MDCREMRFTGSVQGVGFRWTAKRIADHLGLSGSAGNNPDGSVTLVARGEGDRIDKLVAALDERFGSGIAGVESRDVPAGTVPDGFHLY